MPEDRDPVKEQAQKATKDLHEHLDNMAAIMQSFSAACDDFSAALSVFGLSASAHGSASPFRVVWERFMKEFRESLTDDVMAALLIDAIGDVWPDMPKPASAVPQALRRHVMEGREITEPVMRHKLKHLIG